MAGHLEAVPSRINDILSNAKSFDDTLNSQVLMAKYLASQEQYASATEGVLSILSHLGEFFPSDINESQLGKEIKASQAILKDITKEKVLRIASMTDSNKLKAMKFMTLLHSFSNFASPLLAHLLSCRMIQLTFESGFCENSILGLGFISHSLWHYSDDIQLASQVGRIAEALIHEHRNEHSLRARVTQSTLSHKCIVDPFQATCDYCQIGSNSARIVGTYSIGAFYCSPHLPTLQKILVKLLHEMANHKRIGTLHSTMSYFDACTDLIGNDRSFNIDARIEMKTNEELYHTAEQSQNSFLMHHTILNEMHVHFYFREYLPVANLAMKYQTSTGAKRCLDCLHIFYEGMSALCLARDTKQTKWRDLGKKSIEAMAHLVQLSTWNFGHKYDLLQAELHYLDDRHDLAERSYQDSIRSARNHKFIQEEALACELYGIYLVENRQFEKGMAQLQMAMNKYKQWGTLKKANDVVEFMEFINQPSPFL